MGISIILCTYNPNLTILNLCLQSLENQQIDGFEIEGIIVDNNSSTPLKNISLVQEFLSRNPNYRVIEEPKPGLANARKAGFKSAKFDLLTFIDDDNGPESNYLRTSFLKFNKNDSLGALGPGHITVEFISPYKNWILDFKHAFQEKHIDGLHINNSLKWLSIYPPGTGLTVRKNAFKKYLDFIEEENSSITGRIGKSLASGEDIQLIICTIKAGYFAGIDGELKLTHLIGGNKVNLNYLKRVAFGCASSFPPCYLEMFPKMQQERKESMLSGPTYNKMIIKYLINPKNKVWTKKGQRAMASFIGNIVGYHRATGKKVPNFIKMMVKVLKLE